MKLSLDVTWYPNRLSIFKPYLFGLALALVAGVDILVFTGIKIGFQTGIDFYNCYLPATRLVLSGQDPYTLTCFFNPPWVVLPFIPFLAIPSGLAWLLYIALGFAAFAFVASKLGARPLVILAFLLSPAVMYELQVTNISWLVALGLLFPPQIGLFFVLLKPQLGGFVALFWGVEAYRKGGFKEVLRVFAPVTAAFLLSFAAFGLWPGKASDLLDVPWNVSTWPATLPVALILGYESVRQRKIGYAMLAAPFASPYVAFHAWSFALLGLLAVPVHALLGVLGAWAFVILRGGWHDL